MLGSSMNFLKERAVERAACLGSFASLKPVEGSEA